MSRYKNHISVDEIANKLGISKTDLFQSLLKIDDVLMPSFYIDSQFGESVNKEVDKIITGSEFLSEHKSEKLNQTFNLLLVDKDAIRRATRTEGWMFRSDVEFFLPVLDDDFFNKLKVNSIEEQIEIDRELDTAIISTFTGVNESCDFIPVNGASLHELLLREDDFSSLASLIESISNDNFLSMQSRELRLDGKVFKLKPLQAYIIASLKILGEENDGPFGRSEISNKFGFVERAYRLDKGYKGDKNITDVFKEVKLINGELSPNFFGDEDSCIVRHIRVDNSPKGNKYYLNVKKLKIVP